MIPLEEPHRLGVHSKVQAQAYVEYALLVGVAVIAFLIGLNTLTGGATTYMARAEPTPNATVLASLPNHVVSINMSCSVPAPPVYTGTPINCSLTVTDITTIEPATLPRGTMVFTSTRGGTFSPSPCVLAGSGVTSGCTFQYTPTATRRQNITATYSPTSNHQSRASAPQVIVAIDQTQTVLVCPTNTVPVGEPAECDVQVVDLYAARYGPVRNLNVDLTTNRGATFSPVGQLSPRNASTYSCRIDSSRVCGALLRSGAANASDEGTYSVAAAFAGDQDRFGSNAGPVSVAVGGPTQHPVTVDISCDDGQTVRAALQINAGDSTPCTATVTDSNPADARGNPTGITPTGTLALAASKDFGGAGNLSATTCTLKPLTFGVAQCGNPLPRYTPTSVGTPPGPDYVGTHQVTATYSTPDWIHPDTGTQGSTNVYVKDQHGVQVSVMCGPGTNRAMPLLIVGASADTTQCIVKVQDANPANQVTPTGTITWSLVVNGGNGAFAPSAPCQLQPVNASTAQCQSPVTYRPTLRGTPDGPDQETTHTIVATYSGDWLHPGTGGSTNVFVGNLHAVQVSLTCSPATTRQAPLLIGPPPTPTVCTLTVTDPDPTPLTPTGGVAWTMSPSGLGGAGVFSPSNQCQLQAVNSSTARCQSTYQPTARGTPDGLDMDNTHQIVATYLGDGLHPPSNPAGIGTTPVYVHN